MVPIQFITHFTEKISYEEGALLALKGGCRWIQLRAKEMPLEELEQLALRLQAACKSYEATFIIDDHVELAKKINADGVHLGRTDMPISEARKILGEEFIIGGTANSIEDVKDIAAAGGDYIGCGPFRFTGTKKNLSPILGLEGYEKIIQAMRQEGIRLPMCAIGGIELEDVAPLLEIGIDGIAISGSILRAENPEEAMRAFVEADTINN